MSDLISREKVLDVISNWNDNESDIETLAFMIADIPSAEPRKGKWRVVSRQADSFTAYRCSECNELVYGRTDFCPNCGADMRGEANG